MSMFFPGRTKCIICGKSVETVADCFGIPAFIPPGHKFSGFSDACFHRDCYDAWTDRLEFQKLYEQYINLWNTRPSDLSPDEIEKWAEKYLMNFLRDQTTWICD